MTDSEMSDGDFLVAAVAAIAPGWSAPHVQAVAHEWVMAGYSVAHGSMSKAASV